MGAFLVVLGLVVAGGLAFGTVAAVRVTRTHGSAVLAAKRSAVQVQALNTSLAITRTQYNAERAMWEAALQDSGEVRR